MGPRQTLHGCWVVDAWDPNRDEILDAWREAVGAPMTLWHTGQLEVEPRGPVVLRHVDEALESDVSKALGLPEVWWYEHEHRSHAVCADLLRYLAVYLHGGVYIDLDKYPHKNVAEHLWGNADWPDLVFNLEGRFAEIRVIRAREAGHPDLLAVLEAAVANCKKFIAAGGYATQGYEPAEITNRTGPWLVNKMLCDWEEPDDYLGYIMQATGMAGGNGFTRTLQHKAKRLIRGARQFREENITSRKGEVLAAASAYQRKTEPTAPPQ